MLEPCGFNILMSPPVKGPVRCRLEVTLVDESLSYKALSYAWGSQEDLIEILCEDAILGVTRNCAAALYRLRRLCKPRILWVDAICIDQANIAERNQQLALMDEIYKRAHLTVVWLGDINWLRNIGVANRYTKWAFRLIRTIAAAHPTLCSSGKCTPCAKGLKKLVIEGFAWKSLLKVYSLPWLRRIWVIQEAMISPCAVMISGSETINWADVIIAGSCLYSHGATAYSDFCLTFQSSFAQLTFHYRRISYLTDRKIDESAALTGLNSIRAVETSDPRDRVYGLLGACYTLRHLVQNPDYAQSVEEVYTRLARTGYYYLRFIWHAPCLFRLSDSGSPP